MAIKLADRIRRVRADMPPRVLIYGVPGIGKTTLAAEAPNPIFLQLEDGTPAGLELASFGEVPGFAALMDNLKALATEQHDYQTVVLDSLTALEPMIWEETCRRHRWNDIEAAGYGKGYVAADTVWREVLAALAKLRKEPGMAICMIAHCEITRFEDPTVGAYSRYELRLHKRASGIVTDDADIVGFVNNDVQLQKQDVGFNKTATRGTGSGTRFIHFDDRPAYTAKNRHGLPDRMPLKPGTVWPAIMQSLKPSIEEAA